MQWLRGTPALWLVLAVELLVVGQAVWAALQPPVQYTFTPEQLLPLTDEAGFDEQGRFGLIEWSDAKSVLCTPDMNLVAGHYRMKVDYFCPSAFDGEGKILTSSFQISSYPARGTSGDQLKIDGRKTSAVYTLTVHEPCNMSISAYCAGGILRIGQIVIWQDMFWAKLVVLGWLILFAFLNVAIVLLIPSSPAAVTRQTRLAVLVVIGTAFVATLPLCGLTTYATGHDWVFHLQRIECIADAMRCRQFPVRVYPTANSDYGYGAPLFYGELFLYFPAMLRLLGVGVLAAYRAYLFAVNLVTAGIAYVCLYRMNFHTHIALTCTVLYTLSYYRVACLYTRCAVGEYTAMAFLPLVAYGLWLLYADEGEPEKAWLPLMVGFGCCLQSHMITTMLLTLLTLVLVLIWWRKTLTRQRLLIWCKATGGALLLNLWFLIPFLTAQMTGLYVSELYPIQHKGIELRSLFMTDTFVGLGIALGIGALLFLVGGGESGRGTSRMGWTALVLGCVFSLMSTNLFPWDALARGSRLGNFLQVIQFPWRFLSLASFALALATACGLQELLRQKRNSLCMIGAGICLTVTLLSAFQQFPQPWAWPGPNVLNDGSSVQLRSSGIQRFTANELDRMYTPERAVYDGFDHFALAPADGVEVGEFTRDNGVTTVLCASLRDSEGYVELPLLYYPGYKVVDGPGATYLTANGMVGVTVPAGYVGAISVAFREPKRWLLADGVSLVTLLAMLVWPLWKKRRAISQK